MSLEHLEGLDDKVAKILALALGVVNLVSLVEVLGLEQVHDGEDLAVVGHEGLADGIAASHELLQDLEGRGDNLIITRVERDWPQQNKSDASV